LGPQTACNRFFLAVLLLTLAVSSGCQNGSENTSRAAAHASTGPKKIIVNPSSHQELVKLFTAHEYDLENLNEGIPPLVVKSLPENLHQIQDLKEKKKVFFLSILPITLIANQQIQLQREELKEIFKKIGLGEPLSPAETDFLDATLKSYKLSGDPVNDQRLRRELLKRVDIIPPALVLAQAASESAYGTSRFSRLANNLFGEWTFTPGTGIVPLDRPDGKTYEVRRFKTISASLHSYLRNLNTHRAYRELREKRAFMRSEGRPLKSLDLADGLVHYSIQGQKYVQSIKRIILQNRLSRLSQAKLRVPASRSLALDTLGSGGF